MKLFIIFFMLCGSLHAADATNSTATDKRLVEIIFAADDKPPTQSFHTVITLWLSEKRRGSDRHIYDWAAQGGGSGETNAPNKLAATLKLFQPLVEPKVLPDSPNVIVTVRFRQNDKWTAKRFPIDQVPAEVRQILILLGFQDDQFSRLTFIKNTGQQSPDSKKDNARTVTPVSGIQQAFDIGCQKIAEEGYDLDKLNLKIEIGKSSKGGWVMMVNPGGYNQLMVTIATNGVAKLGVLF